MGTTELGGIMSSLWDGVRLPTAIELNNNLDTMPLAVIARATKYALLVAVLLLGLGTAARAQTTGDVALANVINFVRDKGWVANFESLCRTFELVQTDCRFKQISFEDGDFRRGFNVPVGADTGTPHIIVFRLHPAVGVFFIASPNGELIRAFARKRGEGYEALSNSDAKKFFDEELSYWKSNFERLRKSLETTRPQ